ncbi:hypothetical protein TNCV_164011 [Trichonephila clavipes]|nr:hypothetical protein TNCV_164011 [Trichonephila clavipes]
MLSRLVGTTAPRHHDCLIQEWKVSNHGSILITIDCNVVAFIVFEEVCPLLPTARRGRDAEQQPASIDRGGERPAERPRVHQGRGALHQQRQGGRRRRYSGLAPLYHCCRQAARQGHRTRRRRPQHGHPALEKVVRGSSINTRVNIFNKPIELLAFADDIDIIERTPTALRQTFLPLDKEAIRMGLKIKENKSKYMPCTKIY